MKNKIIIIALIATMACVRGWSQTTGSVTILAGSFGGSYDFTTGAVNTNPTGGDAYFLGGSTPAFWSNNVGQTGVGVLGDFGSTPLSALSLTLLGGVTSANPAAGYWTRNQVDAIVGRSYFAFLDSSLSVVALFRVTAVSSGSVSIDYYTPISAVPEPSSVALLLGIAAIVTVCVKGKARRDAGKGRVARRPATILANVS
jgi:hypothetical protein